MDRLNAVAEAAGGGPLKWLEHNRWVVAALVIIAVLVSACVGLQPKVENPLDPESGEVTRSGLVMAVAEWEAGVEAQQAIWASEAKLLEAANEELSLKESWRKDVLAALEPIAVTSAGAFGPLVTLGFGLLSGGLILDNRRKGRLLKLPRTGEPEKTPPA